MKHSLFMILAVLACAGSRAETVSAPEAPFAMPEIAIWEPPAAEFDITAYGAVEGGEQKCTAAFANAIRDCNEAGGGKVVVPPGTWLTGSIHLKSNVCLHLQDGAKIVFTDDPQDYLPPVHTTWEGVELLNYSPLLYAYCCTNVAVTGKGQFAPKMHLWRTWSQRPPAHMAFTAELYEWCSHVAPLGVRDATKMPGSNARPHLLQFNRCANILLDGFSIRESPFWTIHLYHSENAVVRNLDVFAHGHNNDGVDVEMTKNVIIEDCHFDQGDDAIVLKAGRNQDAWALNRCTENVIVRNCEIVDGHVLLGVGSELSGGVRNAYMHDCKMTGNALNVFYIKTNERRGGFVENIYMKDCEVRATGKRMPNSVVGVETDVLYQWRKLPTYEKRITRIRNIVAENVKVNSANYLVAVHGDARDPVEGITLKNVTCQDALVAKYEVMNAKGVTVDGEEIPSREGKAPSK